MCQGYRSCATFSDGNRGAATVVPWFFSCDAAWSTQSRPALIKQESAEDLEAHNVVSLFAPVFVRLHRPTQSDVDVLR